MAAHDMIIIGGVRYRREDAEHLGIRPADAQQPVTKETPKPQTSKPLKQTARK
ncbi:MAG: hypothetical protein LKI34_02855 [Bifidobacterium tibiigranuli]|jgi:hypothetical protein|uniref:hypothetical protein n=1 Tax=Bifidobacterium tibiigranuli TaxID=2172043 RepID=UPI0026EF7B70|nr:hypothetical protein [Bifidobacterium tibiigranuli]MCI1673146.1 hypothetical protein [Bifidobacterium tibiigranuli]MCI1713609.1 hypothetical protein [Bifidobacterium tibiigranuli]